MHQEIKIKKQIEIHKLDNEKLVDLLRNKRKDMTLEAIVIAYDEATGRGLYLDEEIEEFFLNASSKQSWYYVKGSERIGAVSAKELLFLYDTNQINHRTKVWKEGFEDWIELGKTKLILDVSGYVSDKATPPPIHPQQSSYNQVPNQQNYQGQKAYEQGAQQQGATYQQNDFGQDPYQQNSPQVYQNQYQAPAQVNNQVASKEEIQQETKRKLQIETQKLSDNQLKDKLENNKKNMTLEEIVVAYDEASRRGLYLINEVEQFMHNVNTKKSWCYKKDGKIIVDPISAKEVLFRYDINQISPMTKVQKQGSTDWKELFKTKLIFDINDYDRQSGNNKDSYQQNLAQEKKNIHLEIKRKKQIETQDQSDGYIKNKLENDRKDMTLEEIMVVHDEAVRRELFLSEEVVAFVLNVNLKKSWSYLKDGETVGPISAKELLFRYDTNQINPMTKVQKDGDSDWKELGKTKLIFKVSDYMSNRATAQSGYNQAPYQQHQPQAQVNNVYAWFLAFGPIVRVVIYTILFAMFYKLSGNMVWLMVVLSYGVYSLFFIGDINLIGKTPDNEYKLSPGYIILVLIGLEFAYLLTRAKLLNQNKSYAVVSTVFFAISLIVMIVSC